MIMLLKKFPEDFIVEELPLKEWDDSGPFAIFKLLKIGLNTEQAVDIISRRFHIPYSTIKYSGTKDKHAHTTQYISIPYRKGIEDIRMDEDNLKMQHAGFSDEPLSLGTLKGNRFIITARDLSDNEKASLESNRRFIEGFMVPNYFDEQRFSSNNYNIGLSILKRDYKGAVRFMCESSDIFADTVRIYTAAHPNDYVGALQHLPKKILLMFIHAVQSFIFNEALGRILSAHASDKSIMSKIIPYSLGSLVFYDDPRIYSCISGAEYLQLVGFNTEEFNHHVKKILSEVGLVQRDFIVRALPDLSVEGTVRECFIEVKDLEIRLLEDRIILEFELPKGAYATNVVKALID